jgi:acetyltransferase
MEAPPVLPVGTPAEAAPDKAVVKAIVRAALSSGREMLNEAEAKAVLEAYRIPVVATRVVRGGSGCRRRSVAGEIGFPVALKILSPEISHKSESEGGVALGLDTAEEVREAAQTMLARIRRLRPQARIEGFTVQAMARREHAQELIVGATVDRVFGPIILFGQGGTAVEGGRPTARWPCRH